ncbi:methyl-accepting chemotaxis domain-containing protein [Thiomicrorhabdus arctica]|jgi:hypothetical protein|uniref:hypothetical protein n=1 Tax=Thiomicrorhabdus arctica TaxID=131540 RepID=UPI00037B50BD|nr:hypothetical protein [Thiomicrorhabdus arctica]
MSNIVDDLLQEVEQLEESTQQLNDNVENVAAQNSQLKSGEASSIDVDLIALETAKTAQEASLQSHLAAKAAVKTAEQLKSQSLELAEFNYNLRQSVRTATKEIQSTKKTFIALMVGSVVVNTIALSVIGYFFYETNKQNSQFKGQTLDIIQIESNLLSKKITLKVDELSSLIEAMSADIIRMKDTVTTPVKIHSTVNDNSGEMPSKTLINEPISDAKADSTTHSKESATLHHDIATTAIAHETKDERQTSAMITRLKTEQSAIDYSELKTLVEKILAEQHKLQAMTLTGSTADSSDASQVKKLNDIRWLVRKQEKALKAIQANLTNGTAQHPADGSTSKGINNTLNELKVQLRLLTEQQLTIQKQVKNLQTDLTKYASKPAPYSYKAK